MQKKKKNPIPHGREKPFLKLREKKENKERRKNKVKINEK